MLGIPVVPFCTLLAGGFPSKIDYRKKRYPYSILSTGGPRMSFLGIYHQQGRSSAGVHRRPCDVSDGAELRT